MGRAAGRVRDAHLHLLDRQIVDREGRLAGNVDDLELTVPDDGGAPWVSALLAGPAALAEHTGGILRRWLLAVHRRLHHEGDPGPARIPFSVVVHVESDVKVAMDRVDIPSTLLERWVRDNVISKIPGADRAPD
jgi:sporulation protein YlmC with PRC-barrel domain